MSHASRSSPWLHASAGGALARRWSQLHAELYRRTGGRFLPRWFGGPVKVLETRGRRSGRLRRTPLIGVEHGEAMIVIASNAGSDATPAWWLNLRAAGEGWLIERGRRRYVRPRVAEGAERAELWARFAAVYPGVDDYRTFTDRDFPVVLLEPAPSPSARRRQPSEQK